MVFRSLSWPWCLVPFYLYLTMSPTWVASDFAAYLHKILKNHTMHACDRETLLIACPSKTTITILSAFYGRYIPSRNLCASEKNNVTEENTNCISSAATQKVMDECQDQPSCQIPVNSRMFGLDPCPGTSKYLIISYKCRPDNHRSKLVCENERLQLVCRNDTVLAIYSAMFGHERYGNSECPQESGTAPKMDCLSPTALRRVSRRCQGRTNCSLLADAQTFGDPCLPGVRKHLQVSFVCMPRYLLEDVGQGTSDPFLITDYTHGGWYTGPGLRRPTRKVVFFTNSLEIFAQIWGLTEKVALYFVTGICVGLAFLLCLFGLKSTLAQDVKDLIYELREDLKDTQDPGSELMEDLHDTSSDSSVRRLARSYCLAEIFSPELMVEMEEHWEDKELPNGNIFLHRDSSPYAARMAEAVTA